jgi:hypothetical protein
MTMAFFSRSRSGGEDDDDDDDVFVVMAKKIMLATDKSHDTIIVDLCLFPDVCYERKKRQRPMMDDGPKAQ